MRYKRCEGEICVAQNEKLQTKREIIQHRHERKFMRYRFEKVIIYDTEPLKGNAVMK